MYVQLLQNIYTYLYPIYPKHKCMVRRFFFTWIKKNPLSHYTLCYISVITVHMLKIISVK